MSSMVYVSRLLVASALPNLKVPSFASESDLAKSPPHFEWFAIPSDMEVEAYFLAKEDGTVAGISLADLVFGEVDPSLKLEKRTLEEVEEVLRYASQTNTRLMLDNMGHGDVDVTMLREAVELIKREFETEASGNVPLETVDKIGQMGVTFISSGALTCSVKALDVSLKIDTELALEVGKRTKRT